MNEAFLTLLRFGLDTEGGANQQLWVQKLAESIQSVEDLKLMSHICRTFVEGIEFRGSEYQAVDTQSIVNYHLNLLRSDIKDTNLVIYVLTRDSKLLQLREKLEETQSAFAGRRVDFLFKLCLKHQIDIDQALTRLQSIDPDVYLVLNKQAKELGLRQT